MFIMAIITGCYWKLMARNVDTSLLRAFMAVAETAGMTSAANILSLTQAAVSQQIKRLEDSFGCQLFERDRRGMKLTDAGERLFGKAKRLLALNDEIWAEMTSPLYEGEVRLGVPHDLVNAYLPPVLKSFAKTYPKVKIALVCRPSLELLSALGTGQIDLILVEERVPGADAEVLAIERLIWVGAKGGEAHLKRPLPISFGNETCIFRAAVTEALGGAGIEWWAMSEIGNMEALNATVHTDLAVMSLLASTVPAILQVLGPASGLPILPTFSISLYLPRTGATEPARELASHLRAGLVGGTRQAA
jgi:DNA-binding transcriptional LysR family regulator